MVTMTEIISIVMITIYFHEMSIVYNKYATLPSCIDSHKLYTQFNYTVLGVLTQCMFC